MAKLLGQLRVIAHRGLVRHPARLDDLEFSRSRVLDVCGLFVLSGPLSMIVKGPPALRSRLSSSTGVVTLGIDDALLDDNVHHEA
jgi:hypothetical protein